MIKNVLLITALAINSAPLVAGKNHKRSHRRAATSTSPKSTSTPKSPKITSLKTEMTALQRKCSDPLLPKHEKDTIQKDLNRLSHQLRTEMELLKI